jgi:hypothetical protein
LREEALAEVEAAGGKPYAIPAGASEHRLGGLGFANWAFEVAEQEKALGVFFDTIVVCTVTGSTHAGMIAGFAALQESGDDRPRRVLGIDASATLGKTRAQVERIARHTAALIELGRDLRPDEISVLEGWAGDLYGIPVESTIEAIRLSGRLEAMIIDWPGSSTSSPPVRSAGTPPCSTPTWAGSPRSAPIRRSSAERGAQAVMIRESGLPPLVKTTSCQLLRGCGDSADITCLTWVYSSNEYADMSLPKPEAL